MQRFLYTALCAAGFLLHPSLIDAASLEGDWLGKLAFNGVQLRLVLHLTQSSRGYQATLDSPDQSAKGIPVDTVSISGSAVKFTIASFHGAFDGQFDPNQDAISGTWSQGPAMLPLQFQRMTEPLVNNRPQEPHPPYPYNSENVTIENTRATGVRLAGTLTEPRRGGPFPGILLIPGSGPENRDEEIFGHKPFLLLADTLTRKGFAVLRLDKRGIGKSTGDANSATLHDLASDAEAAFRFLLGRNDIDIRRSGVIGHSEGGDVAMMLAARMPEVSYLVLLAAPGVPGDDLVSDQVFALNLAGGASQTQSAQAQDLEHRILQIVKANDDPADASKKITALAGDNTALQAHLASQLPMLLSPGYRSLIRFKPAAPLLHVKCPVLAIDGGKDLQVNAFKNLAAIQSALQSGGNDQVATLNPPNVNHLLQTAQTGAITEYGEIEETIAQQVLNKITDWLEKEAKLK